MVLETSKGFLHGLRSRADQLNQRGTCSLGQLATSWSGRGQQLLRGVPTIRRDEKESVSPRVHLEMEHSDFLDYGTISDGRDHQQRDRRRNSRRTSQPPASTPFHLASHLLMRASRTSAHDSPAPEPPPVLRTLPANTPLRASSMAGRDDEGD